MKGVNLTGAYMQCAHVYKANMEHAILDDITGTVHKVEVPGSWATVEKL
jgi:hypothetical protein